MVRQIHLLCGSPLRSTLLSFSPSVLLCSLVFCTALKSVLGCRSPWYRTAEVYTPVATAFAGLINGNIPIGPCWPYSHYSFYHHSFREYPSMVILLCGHWISIALPYSRSRSRCRHGFPRWLSGPIKDHRIKKGVGGIHLYPPRHACHESNRIPRIVSPAPKSASKRVGAPGSAVPR